MQSSVSRSPRRWLVGLLILLLVAALAWWLWPAATPAHKEAGSGRGGKGMGCPIGAADGELDFLVDLARQAPNLIRGPHQVRGDMDA